MNFETGSSRKQENLHDMIAMVDVVFILLAFFVLTSQFLGDERDVALGHQQLTPSAGQTSEDLPSAIAIRLSLSAEGSVQIRVGQNQLAPGDFDGITQVLSQVNLPSTPVVIASDPRLRVEHVARAMDAALASPMKMISLAGLSSSNPDGD